MICTYLTVKLKSACCQSTTYHLVTSSAAGMVETGSAWTFSQNKFAYGFPSPCLLYRYKVFHDLGTLGRICLFIKRKPIIFHKPISENFFTTLNVDYLPKKETMLLFFNCFSFCKPKDDELYVHMHEKEKF